MSKLNDRDKMALYSSMNTMLNAGVPINEVVDMMLADSAGDSKEFIQLLQKRLNEGGTVSSAMELQPKSFDAVSVNMMRAAEEAGTMEETLQDLEKSTKQRIAFNDEVRASMMYPAFVFVIFMGILLLMLLFVVPRISKVIVGMRTTIPPMTQFVFDLSDFIINNYGVVIAAIVVFIALLVVLYKLQKNHIINALYNLPLLNSLGKNVDLSRFCRSMSLMLRAGIPITEALKASKSTVRIREVSKMVDHMIENVDHGHNISEGIDEKSRVVPPLMIRLTKTAEYSGSLENSMQKLADYFQDRASRTLKTITSLIEPALIIVVGLLTGGLMLTIIAPIYSLISNIRVR